MPRKALTYTRRFDNARSEQGWNVLGSQPAEESKVWMLVKIVFASFPERPLFVLAVIELDDGFQYDCKGIVSTVPDEMIQTTYLEKTK